MGYSYTRTATRRLLDCDVCGHSGKVRRYRCPFNYCQPIALCRQCHTEHPEYTSVEYHRQHGCEAASLKFRRQQDRERELLAAGQYVRCAAANWSIAAKTIPDGAHVLFRNAQGHVVA